MADTRIITFDFDNDNRPIRDEEVEGKLFEPQYKQALLQIESYLRELDLEKIEENQGHTDGKVYTEHIGKDIDYNNNIFAFVGDRGTGKTSCMISVAGLLIEKHGVTEATHPFIYKDHFETIDLIDPAYFDRSHYLISLFLAKLYKSFLEKIDKVEKSKDEHVSSSDKQKFLHYYREAHSQLHRLYHEKKKDNFSDEDLMEYVEDASASVNLKRTIKDLVDAYIDCFHWKDTILILRIDDVDMDFGKASEMIESMRKYFIQPNLLVFVSCSLEQLRIIKTRDFLTEIKDVNQKGWCEDLADRYLAKVFPQSHCIKMPEPSTYHDYELVVSGRFETEAGIELKEEKDEKEISHRKFVSVKQALPELILKKTRYLFYNTNYYESYIVPRNLRELRQLMKLLITMPDFNAGGASNHHNKTLFMEYFLGTWVQSNLDATDRKYVLKMQSVHDISLFNKTLQAIIEERFTGGVNVEPKAKSLLEKEQLSRHITTANILDTFSAIEPSLVEEKDRRLLFFIKSYYSMLLYDSYCEILGDLDENKNRKLERVTKELEGKTSGQIIRKDRLNEFYDYEKLVGGCFIHLSNPRAVVLNAGKLSRFVKKCIVFCSEAKPTEEQNAKILLAELLVLSIHYARKNDTDESIDYFSQMKSLPKEENLQLVINTGALLFNMTRYDQSIVRYSEAFYKALKESPAHKNIKQLITEQESDSNDYGYTHRVSLRNFEVMQDIITQYSGIEVDRTIPTVFFSDLDFLSKYSFPLYEYEKGKEEYKRIRLTFLQTIREGVQAVVSKPGFVSKLFDNTSSEEEETPNATGNSADVVSEPAAEHVAEGTEATK